MTADPRLLARFDGDAGQWHIDEGTYKVAVGKAADALDLTAQTTLTTLASAADTSLRNVAHESGTICHQVTLDAHGVCGPRARE